MGCVKSRHSVEADEINNSDTDVEEEADPEAIVAGPVPVISEPDPEVAGPIALPESEPEPVPESQDPPKFQGPYIATPSDPSGALQSIDNVDPKSMEPTQREIREAQKEAARKIAEQKEAVRKAAVEEEAAEEAARKFRVKKDAAEKEAAERKAAQKEASEKKVYLQAEADSKGKMASDPDHSKGASSKENANPTTASKPVQTKSPSGTRDTKNSADDNDKSAKDRIASRAQAAANQDSRRTNLDKATVTQAPYKPPYCPLASREGIAKVPDTTPDPSSLTNCNEEEEGNKGSTTPPIPPNLLNLPFRTLPHPNWILKKQRRKRGVPSTSTPQKPFDPSPNKRTLTIIDPLSDPLDPLSPRIDNAMTVRPPAEFGLLPGRSGGEDSGVKDGLGWLPLRLCPYGCTAFPFIREFLKTVDAPLWVEKEGANAWEVTVREALGEWGVEFEGVGDVVSFVFPSCLNASCPCPCPRTGDYSS